MWVAEMISEPSKAIRRPIHRRNVPEKVKFKIIDFYHLGHHQRDMSMSEKGKFIAKNFKISVNSLFTVSPPGTCTQSMTKHA